MAGEKRRRTVFVRHCDPNGTGEGLGSHARGTLYPLLRIALHFDWKVLWEANPPGLASANHRSEYVHELQNLGQWLGFCADADCLIKKNAVGISIDLDNDVRLGRILGYPGILISSIESFCEENGEEALFGSSSSEQGTFLVTLNGRFEYQDDPTWPVIQFLQKRCLVWKQHYEETTVHLESKAEYSSRVFRVAIHVRVPEDYCEQNWKDANSIAHSIRTMQSIHKHLQNLEASENKVYLTVDVYTETSFTSDSELELRRSLESLSSIVRIMVHRQTPLLSTVQDMAVSDIFIPASSFLSAMVSYFHNSLIVLPDEETRCSKYFAPHLKYDGCPIVQVQNEEDLLERLEDLCQQTK